MRSETRATLVAAIARGRRWLSELTMDASLTTNRIAERERCSEDVLRYLRETRGEDGTAD